ncbi:MAG: hypothetical protein EZS28_023587 [Streblomastix strix]|uniref:Uncharacterized protein n=1 Tax=Streblomastix strix TaxID=222440 RepID=A0A5J4VED0_9EUKA|nr:MAG: hypothetical protein EZS28_023587 [Streblomastix strix]
MFSKVSEQQRSYGADTISQSTKHQKIEPLTSAVSASYGLGVACFWSIIKSIFFISIGKNHVGYYYIANVINTLFILEKDIIVYIYVPDIGQLVDYVLMKHKLYIDKQSKQAVSVYYLLFVGPIAVLPRSLQLINRTEYKTFAGGSLSSNNVIMSGFSAFIIAQAKQEIHQISDQVNSCPSLQKKQYPWDSDRNKQLQQKQQQLRLNEHRQTHRNDVCPKLYFLMVKQQYNYQRQGQIVNQNKQQPVLYVQIDVSHNLVLSLQKALYQNGPHAVENPNQNLRTSPTLYFYVAYFISAASAVVAVQVPLKFVLDLANSAGDNKPYVKFTLFNCIPIVLAGMEIVQLTQQVQTQQQVALPLAPRELKSIQYHLKLKYFLASQRIPIWIMRMTYGSIVKVLNTSFRAEFDETQSECDAFDK